MFHRAQLNILHLILTFFTALRLVSSRSVAVSPNNEAKNTEGQVGSKTKQLLRQQNNDVIAAHVRPPLRDIILLHTRAKRPDPAHNRDIACARACEAFGHDHMRYKSPYRVMWWLDGSRFRKKQNRTEWLVLNIRLFIYSGTSDKGHSE